MAPGADVVARATAALSLALAIGAVAGIAPARAQACEPPGFGARGRAEGDGVVFEVDGSELAVAIENIEKARLVPDWVALGLAPARDKSGRDARPGKQKAQKTK